MSYTPYPGWAYDFNLLPRPRRDGVPSILPTPLYVLEQGEDLLFYRRFNAANLLDAGQEVSQVQGRIFRKLVELGEASDTTKVNVLVVRGKAGEPREMAVYDQLSYRNRPEMRQSDDMQIQEWIANWFAERRHIR